MRLAIIVGLILMTIGSFGIVGATLIEMSRIPIFKMKENTKKFYFYLSKKS